MSCLLGLKNGRKETVFGRIKDVSVNNGNIYVLDSRYNEIRIYSKEGDFVKRYGRPGRGPGEFSDPYGIDVLEKSTFLVADGINVSKIKYTEEGGAMERVLRRESMSVGGVNDVCIMDSTFVVNQMVAKNKYMNRMYRITNDSTYIVGKFGERYTKGNDRLKVTLSSGILSCNEDNNIIVNAYKVAPLVQGFESGGGLSWVSKISDNFSTMQMVYSGNDNMLKKNPYEVVTNITRVNEEIFLLQVAHVNVKSALGKKGTKYDTYIVSYDTGEGIHVSSSLGNIESFGDGILVVKRNLPFPKLKVYSYK